jgi:cytochrome d ubiquinol oxidase subunit I
VDPQLFLLDLMRLKFGLMACFHYIFVPLTLGLIVTVACMEAAHVWTREQAWGHAARFWFRLFALGWILGVITGYPLRAQLSGDWGRYSTYIKPLLDRILPVEAAIGPVMLVGIAAIAILQYQRYPKARMLVAWGLVSVMIVQSITILALNAWMQHPVGAALGRQSAAVLSMRDVFLNPMAISKVTHVLSASLVCGSTLICAVALSYFYRRQHLPVARVSLRLGMPLGLLSTALVILTGHLSAAQVAEYQPMKFASFEGLWQQEFGPAGLIVFANPQLQLQSNRNAIEIPYLLSVLSGNGLSGSPPGIREAVADQEDKIRRSLAARPNESLPNEPLPDELQGPRQLYEQERALSNPDSNRALSSPDPSSGPGLSQTALIHRAALSTIPNVPVLFGAFHLMVSIGFSLFTVYALGLALRKRFQTERYRLVLLLLPWVLPLPWLASFAGWIVAEMGRQPWVIYGYLPTAKAAMPPPLAGEVYGMLLLVAGDMLLGMSFGLLSLRLLRQGPEAPLIPQSWWKRVRRLAPGHPIPTGLNPPPATTH